MLTMVLSESLSLSLFTRVRVESCRASVHAGALEERLCFAMMMMMIDNDRYHFLDDQKMELFYTHADPMLCFLDSMTMMFPLSSFQKTNTNAEKLLEDPPR